MSSIILVGYNDSNYFVSGWYGLEKSPEGLLYRASSARGVIQLPITGKIQIGLLLSARPEHVGYPLQVTIQTDSKSLFQFDVKTNHWILRQGVLNLAAKQAIGIEIQNPWSPDALYHNGDIRSLGILLSAIRVIRLEKS